MNCYYSYGDSAGIAPDFPFNPDRIGDQIVGKCKNIELTNKGDEYSTGNKEYSIMKVVVG